jgi:chromosome segregation ATPase
MSRILSILKVPLTELEDYARRSRHLTQRAEKRRIKTLRRSAVMSESPEDRAKCGSGCQRIEVPSREEVEALNAMREIKKKVRELNKAISPLSTNRPGEKAALQRLELEMERLKEDWKEWEQKRKEAARVRMILLGHEKPD